MEFLDRVNHEYREALIAFTHAVPADYREMSAEGRRAVGAPMAEAAAKAGVSETVTWDDSEAPGPAGNETVRTRVYRPIAHGALRPGMLLIHGGGMWAGSLDSEHLIAIQLCEATGAVVVSVDYRLAPENPYPAGVDDCFAALQWMAAEAASLGVDPGNIAIYGGSAGGGLAIATALVARDRNGPDVRFLMAIYPMIDDRNDTPSAHEIADLPFMLWDRSANREGWAWYLGGRTADQYAAPARAEDLAGLPPTFIDVGELDLFRDEDIDFAARLMQAGVSTELHVYPGAFHASEYLAPNADLSRRIISTRVAALRRALRHEPEAASQVTVLG